MPWYEGRHQPARPLTNVELEMSRQAVRDQAAAITAKIREEDARHSREQAAKRAAHENEQRGRAEAEVAAFQARVEHDLRQQGCPVGDIRRLVNEAVTARFAERARTAAAMPSVEQTTNELRRIRRGRGRVDVSAA